MIDRIKSYFERHAFGVCEWWAEKLNIKTEQVRLSFIYLSFVTVGLHLVVYLFMAFNYRMKIHNRKFKPNLFLTFSENFAHEH